MSRQRRASGVARHPPPLSVHHALSLSRHPATALLALSLAAAAAAPARAADGYRFTAHLVGLYGGAPSSISRPLQLTESGIVYGTQLEADAAGRSRFVGYQWSNGVNQRLFEMPWVVGGNAETMLAVSETGIFLTNAWARQGDTVQTLGTMPDTAGPQVAARINDTGRIVGTRTVLSPAASQQQAPTAWQFGGPGAAATASGLAFPTDFRQPSGIALRDINAAGTAVGQSAVSPTILRGTVWRADGSAALLPSLSNDPVSGQALLSDGVDISHSGWVAGYADQLAGNGLYIGNRAVRWAADGSLVNLGTLSTKPNGEGLSRATAINEQGDVAGTFQQYAAAGTSLGMRAFVWDAATQSMRNLGTLGAATNGTAAATAIDINDAGQAVGASDWYERRTPTLVSNRGSRATFADTGGSFVDLNTLTDPASLARPGVQATAVLRTTVEINNRGWILVVSSTNEAFVLVPTGDSLAPVPEPRALGLMALGLAAIGWRLRRRPHS